MTDRETSPFKKLTPGVNSPELKTHVVTNYICEGCREIAYGKHVCPKYKIIRFSKHSDDQEIIETGLTLDQAQAHCRDDSTSTDDWFDGYERIYP
jgi:hypothetical protein